MTFHKLANATNAGWLALLAAMAGSTSNACSNSPPPAPTAFVQGQIGPGIMDGVDDASACGGGDLSWTLGNPVSGAPVAYADGSTQNGGAVHIFCSVDSSGSGFSVDLSAELDGQMSGTLVVSGNINATGTSTGLSGSFSTAGQHFIANKGCTFTQTYGGQPVPANGVPAQGRIWGHIDCPIALDNGQEGLGADGGEITRTCDASADFQFENCD